LTSQAADDAMINDLNLSRDRRAQHIDQMAATIILQSGLDQLKRLNTPS
jgi:RNase H-fold protein (predicted Holliday junction resolvase)